MVINIIPTSSAEHIALLLDSKPDLNIIFQEKNKDNKRYFPDGEIYSRIIKSKILEGPMLVLHAGSPSPNDGIIELEMILSNIIKPSIFFTYFPYSRQDKVFNEGEISAAELLVKKLKNYYDVQQIFTIDAHFITNDWPSLYCIRDISALDCLKSTVEKDYHNLVFMAPDMGSQKRTGLKGVTKKRIDSFNINISTDQEFAEAVKGKVVCVTDDILATGGTLIKFRDECLKNGAEEVIAMITHGSTQKGIDRIKQTYKLLYLTNSINRKESNVDISDLVYKTIIGAL